jgi:hypothetical protein
MMSEPGETSMVVRISLGAANPEIAFQLRSQVQEHILEYLNQFTKGSLIGAVADQRPPRNSEPTIGFVFLEFIGC